MDGLNVPDYVLQVFSRLGKPVFDSTGWLFSCPSVTHGGKGVDKNPSLRVTIGDSGKIILHCRTGCDTKDVLAAVGLSFVDLYCPVGEVAADPLISLSSSQVVVPAGMCNDVYSFIIEHLGLHDSHICDLVQRGISPSLANTLRYRSLLTIYDQNKLLILLNDKFSSDLSQVPGFRSGPQGSFEFSIDPKGLIIPIRDIQGNIIALKTRRSISPKYILWSTRNGPSAGTPIHCPLLSKPDLSTIRVTEGEIKSDIASSRTNLYTISIPGVNSWGASLDILASLQPRRVLLSFDYPDVLHKGGVVRMLRLFAEELCRLGYEVGLETWDITNPKAKGVDDALVLELPLTPLWGEKGLETIRDLHSGEKKDIPFFSLGDPAVFPTCVFPFAIREFILQHSQAIQCPEDFMAVSVLAAAARCLGTTRSIALDNQWHELPNQYLCIVAPPSAGKSPACKRVLKPLRKAQKLDAIRFHEERKSYRLDIVDWKEKCREARRFGTVQPVVPFSPKPIEHFWVSDITVETVAKRLEDNQSGSRHDPALLYFRDEILAWVKSLNAYRSGRGADREFFLSTWSNEDVKVDRKTDDETIIVSGPALTILGGIQPDLLSELNNDTGKDDGFFARILFSFPHTKIGFEPSSFVPDPDLEKTWETVCRRLMALTPLEESTPEGHCGGKTFSPVVIPLSLDAIGVWNEWLMADAEVMRAPSFPAHLLSCWGKHRAILARLALVLHFLHGVSCCDSEHNVDEPITADAFRGAIELLKYFRSHYQRVIKRINFGPEEQKVENFIKYVLLHHSGSISIRDIYRKKLFECRGKEDAEALCKLAVDRGFGLLEKSLGSTGGRPSLVFLVRGD